MRRLAGLIPALALALTTIACGQTDAGITTAVKSKLAADDSVSAYQLDVDTADGVVTLSGRVDTTAARERAVMLARDTDGVRDVVDNLDVGGAAATSGDIDTGANDAADAARDGAGAVVDGVKEGAGKAAEGAREAGREIGDAVDGDGRDRR